MFAPAGLQGEFWGAHPPSALPVEGDLQQTPFSHKSLRVPQPLRKITVKEHKLLAHPKAALGVCRSQSGICINAVALICTLMWRGELTGVGWGAFSTQHKGCCWILGNKKITKRLVKEWNRQPREVEEPAACLLQRCSPKPSLL